MSKDEKKPEQPAAPPKPRPPSASFDPSWHESVNVMSKPALKEQFAAALLDAHHWQQLCAMRDRALAALAVKYDRGLVLGPDELLVQASLDLPPLASLGLPEMVQVDIIDAGNGAGRVLVQRVAQQDVPKNGDTTAKPALLGADGKALT